MAGKVPDIGEQEVYAGDDLLITTRLKIRVGNNSFIPEDLTGWTSWTAWWKPNHTAPADQAIPLAVTVTLPNQIELRATEVQTRNMAKTTNGVFDVQATRAGITRTFYRGTTRQTGDVSP